MKAPPWPRELPAALLTLSQSWQGETNPLWSPGKLQPVTYVPVDCLGCPGGCWSPGDFADIWEQLSNLKCHRRCHISQPGTRSGESDFSAAVWESLGIQTTGDWTQMERAKSWKVSCLRWGIWTKQWPRACLDAWGTQEREGATPRSKANWRCQIKACLGSSGELLHGNVLFRCFIEFSRSSFSLGLKWGREQRVPSH